jgi:hypothetical protein
MTMSTMNAIAALQAAFITPASGVNTAEILEAELRLKELPQEHAKALAPLQAEHGALTARIEGLGEVWGAEKRALAALKVASEERVNKIKGLNTDYVNQQTAAKRTIVTLRMQAELAMVYPRIAIGNVSWCVGKNFNLIPYPLNVGSVNLEYLWGGYWEDAFGRDSTLSRKCCSALRTHTTYTLSKNERVSFPGFIPQEAKRKYRTAKEDHFSGEDACVFMVVDYKTLTKVVVDPDPLIVGWHPAAPADLWLIAAFDLTPAEAVIAEAAREAHAEMKRG